jgi:hypothetical protein
MEPIFTLPYSEYVVAQQLASLLKSSQGFSLYTPLSRQEKGVDLIATHRTGRVTRATSIQVKGSRTYSDRPEAKRSRPYRYYTWFNTFELPTQADFVVLVAIYPAAAARESRAKSSWWSPVILLFTHDEMRAFLASVRTRAGHPDRMFGFGFDDEKRIFQTRGDSERLNAELSRHLLRHKVGILRSFLTGGEAPSITS